MAVLIVAEQNAGQLRPAVANAVTAAVALGGPVDVLVCGQGAELASAAQQAAQLNGVTRVLTADAAHLAAGLAEAVAAQALSVVKGGSYSHVVAAATSLGKSTLPRLAALLDVAQVSDVVAIKGPDHFVRPIYAGNGLAEVKTADAVKLLTIRTTAFAAAASGGSAATESVAVADDPKLAQFVSHTLQGEGRPDLTTAKIVVSGGQGLNKDGFVQLAALADKLGAALGASRAAVDAGFLPNDAQVGQTGKIVAPDLYLAVGISGAIQHLAGCKDSKIIAAINTDPEAQIFQVADFGLVADAAEAVPELLAHL